ncbi:MAG: cation transporter [Syntrophothermus sp.]
MTKEKLYIVALYLAIFTIGYNLIEGLVSTFFGFEDETLTLFGFGIDSFIEVISGIGILQLVLRIRQNPDKPVSGFEIRALKITGFSFLALSAGLTIGIIFNLIAGRKPESTFWGVIISGISIIVMIGLVILKKRTGKALQSAPILADANCTLVCIYMSLVLLGSSLLYELTGFAYADVIGTAGLVWFSISEGRESLEKAKERSYECCSCHEKGADCQK